MTKETLSLCSFWQYSNTLLDIFSFVLKEMLAFGFNLLPELIRPLEKLTQRITQRRRRSGGIHSENESILEYYWQNHLFWSEFSMNISGNFVGN